MAEARSYHIEDEALEKAYDSTLMQRLMSYLMPHKWLALLTLFLLLVTSILAVLRPWFFRIAIDFAISPENIAIGVEQRIAILIRLALFFLLAEVMRWGMGYFVEYLLLYLGQKIIYAIRLKVFSHLQRLSLNYFDKNPVGRLVTRVTNDVNALDELFSEGLIALFGDLFLILGVIVIMCIVHLQLALITLTVIPLLVAAAIIFRSLIRGTLRIARAKLAAINAFLQENLMGMKVIQLFNREKKNAERFHKINKAHLDQVFKAVNYSAYVRPAVTVLSAIAIGLVLWYGGTRVIKLVPSIKPGILFAFIWWAQMFYRPILDISEKYNILQRAMASSERIFKLLDTRDQIPDAADAVELDDVRGEIEFKNVDFAYNEDEYVLKDVSFKVHPGERVAFVGATGAGKTSIVNLILRFYDVQRGEVLIDGRDVRTIGKESLRKHIGLVLQDVFIFSGDIAGNIRLGDEQIALDEVERSARYVNADRFIQWLPGRYEAEVRERGSTLSAGQRQLIAFARALVHDPKILILDEATSNVDTETEMLIRDAIKKLIKDRTSIIVAHRLSTIQNVDKIIVIHKGEIREIGSHQELLKRRGLYYRLYQLQYKDQERITAS